MDQVSKFGQMVQSTKVNGDTIKLMAKESSGMLMVTYMKATGKKTRLTVSASTFMPTEQDMKASGVMIFKTAGELKAGLMAQNTKEATKKE